MLSTTKMGLNSPGLIVTKNTIWCRYKIIVSIIVLVPEYPQLTNIDGRADSATENTLQVSFLKWSQQMIGNTAPTE